MTKSPNAPSDATRSVLASPTTWPSRPVLAAVRIRIWRTQPDTQETLSAPSQSWEPLAS